jgi:hypothetical protein
MASAPPRRGHAPVARGSASREVGVDRPALRGGNEHVDSAGAMAADRRDLGVGWHHDLERPAGDGGPGRAVT